MSLVLAIEPGRAQAELLREVHAGLGVQVLIVSSKDEALAALDREIPDLILVNALLSPREENDLVTHLRSLENASHLQLLTIPLLSRGAAAASTKSSLFGFGKKKKAAQASEGCDLASFGEQVTQYLARAQEVKGRPRTRVAPTPAVKVPEPAPREEQSPAYEPAAAAAPYAPVESTPIYEPPLAEYERPLAEDEPPAEDVPITDVDSLFDRLGFAPAASTDTPVIEPELRPEPIAESEVLIDLDSSVDSKPPDLAGDSQIGRLESLVSHYESSIDRLEAPAADAAPLVDLGQIRAEAEAAFRSELERVQADAAEQRERELARVQAEAAQQREHELERLQTEAAEQRERELQRVQAEAAQQRERELTQWQAEAEALREATVGRARAEAEREAREALEAELARSRAEAEQLRQGEIARLQAQTDERLEEVTREARQVAEAEAARAFAEELARVRADSEATAARTLEDEVSRVRAAADTRLQAELDRVRHEAEEARRAEQATAQAEADRIREAAAREAREIAEAAAARTLQAEIERVRAEAEAVRAAAEARLAEQSRAHADASQAIAEAERVREAAAREAREIAEATAVKKLEAELARVRAEADARLQEQREAQVEAERMREATAREARAVAEAAATQALETEMRRVKAEADARLSAELDQLRADAEQRRAMELEQMRRQVDEMREAAAQQARSAATEAIANEVARAAGLRGSTAPIKPVPVVRVQPAKAEAPAPVAEAPPPSQPQSQSSSYYDLWRAEGSPGLSVSNKKTWAPSVPSRFRKKPWMLPAAAAALLVLCGSIGLTMDTSAMTATAKKVFGSAIPDPGAKKADAAAVAAPPSGDLLVETTPKGAQVSIDGVVRGKTPLTIAALAPGKHKVVLESSDGVIVRREVTIRAGERAVASELMVSGWLTVFSRIPVDVYEGTRKIGVSGDQQMMLSPGRHKLTFVNKQYNIRETRTVDVQAGSIASHSLTLPKGTLNVDAPAGAEVLVDGDRIGDAPLRGASVPAGTRIVVVRHPSFGERHETVDVRPGKTATITITASQSNEPGRSFDGLKVLQESAANPGLRKPSRPRP